MIQLIPVGAVMTALPNFLSRNDSRGVCRKRHMPLSIHAILSIITCLFQDYFFNFCIPCMNIELYFWEPYLISSEKTQNPCKSYNIRKIILKKKHVMKLFDI